MAVLNPGKDQNITRFLWSRRLDKVDMVPVGDLSLTMFVPNSKSDTCQINGNDFNAQDVLI